MPIHNWKRVLAGTFHDLHQVWVGNIRSALNDGLLPPGFYAQVEQAASGPVADVLTLHDSSRLEDPDTDEPAGSTAVAVAPPQVSISAEIEQAFYTLKQSRVAIPPAQNVHQDPQSMV